MKPLRFLRNYYLWGAFKLASNRGPSKVVLVCKSTIPALIIEIGVLLYAFAIFSDVFELTGKKDKQFTLPLLGSQVKRHQSGRAGEEELKLRYFENFRMVYNF